MSDRGEERVELLRTHDALQAETIRDLLQGEAIPVATPGLEHRAMTGVLAAYVEIVIQVPRRDIERAQAVLDALDAPPVDGPDLRDEDPQNEVVDYRSTAREHRASTLFGKRRRVAAFMAFALPGGGHLYVQEWRTAGIIVLVELLALALMFAGLPTAIAFVPVAQIADALGASWHCERIARGEAVPSLRRFAPDLVALLFVAYFVLAMTPAGAWLR